MIKIPSKTQCIRPMGDCSKVLSSIMTFLLCLSFNSGFSQCSTGATINITEPDPWEVIDAGTNFNITWNGSLQGSSCPVGISYRVNNGAWTTISSSTSDDGSYNWSVPSNINSTDVDLGVVYTTLDANGNAVGDIVSNFDIIPPCSDGATINITEPDPWEVIDAGTNFNITWNGSLQGSSCPVGISYRVNNGAWTTISSSTSDDGSYNWSVPSGINSTDVDLGVVYTTVDANGNAIGDIVNNFDIIPPPSPELEFEQCIDVPNPTVVANGTLGNITYAIDNIGSTTWTGDVFVTLTDPNNPSNNQTLSSNTNVTISSTSTYFGSTGLNTITVPVGNYRVLVGYTNAPSGGTDLVSAGSCQPSDTANGTGTTYHYEDVTVISATPPELEFEQCLSVPNPTVVINNTLGNITYALDNVGTTSWTGDIFVTLTDPNNPSNNQTLSSNTNVTISSTSTYFGSTGLNTITVPVGNYRVLVGYTNAPSGGADFASAGSCQPSDTANGTGTIYHYEDVTVVSSIPPELEFEQCISLSSSTIETGTNLENNTFELQNIGTSSWTGDISAVISEVGNGGNFQTIGSYNNVTISSNGYYFANTGTDLITLNPGNYRLLVTYTNAPNGGLDFVSAGTCTPSGTLNGTVYHYENITISAAGCTSFNDLPNTPPDLEAFEAAQCLCSHGYITPQNGNVNPDANIIRQDLAKLVYYTLYRGDAASPAEDFPVPFTDLNDATQPYYKYAKALCYLEYGDGISPFNRSGSNFYPSEEIEMRYALKVILEAFNIPIDYTDGGTIQNVTFGDDAYEYVHTAWDMGLITSTSADATTNAVRKNIFIVMKRLISSSTTSQCNSECQQDCWPLPNNAIDYFVPGAFTLNSLARNVNISEGYFDQYQKTSFIIPGRNMDMDFTHSYNSYLLEIPSELRKVCPLGEGWTHSYNSYIIEQEGSGPIPDMLYVYWPDGSINQYDRNTLNSESLGVFDIMTESGSNIYIKKKNQIEYRFEKSGEIWYLGRIEDRNNNFINIEYENAINTSKRIDYVQDAHNRELYFYYKSGTDFIDRVWETQGNRNVYFNVNGNGNLTSYTNPKNNNTTYTYGTGNLNNYLETITLPEGNTMDITYNANKRVDEIKFPGINQPFDINVTPNHGSAQPYESSITNPLNGITTTNEFDDTGRLTMKEVGNSTTDITYTADKLPEKITFESQVTDITYDSNGNVLEIDQPLGIIHTYTYNSLNDITSYKDPKNNITTYTYDSNDNLDKITDNLNFVTNYNFNTSGQLTSIINPENITTSFSYNTYGNQISINQPLGITTTFDYDNISRLVESENAENQVTNYVYDVHNLVTEMERESTTGNILTQYGYNLNDNLTAITNDDNNITSMTYNNRDQLETMTFGDDTKTFEYRDDNLLEKYIRPNGVALNYTYDSHGRITNDGYSSYTYDSRNNIKTITHNGTVSFNYDALDRITDYNDIYSKSVDYTYDSNSNVTQVEYPGNYDVNYVYDDNNRLIEVKFNNNSRTIAYTYFDDGRLKKLTYPNGTTTDYGYDAAARMISLITKKSDNSIICSYSYTMDNLGNHTNVTATEPFASIPPLTSLTYNATYNGENETVSYGGSTFEHNTNGEQTKKNGRSLFFDNGGMITSNGNRDYVYDGMKFMMEANRSGTTRRYTWDIRGIGNVIVESDGAGNALYYYIHGHGLCARVNASNTNDIRYYHGDYRGSTIAMSDQNQNITHQYQYLPYGEISQAEEADTNNPFKYVGQWGVMHEGGNHYYMRARQYDAETGRFLSEDPIWHDNLYPYADNNPIAFIDAIGKNSELTSQYSNTEMYSTVPEFNGQKNSAIGKVKTFVDFFKGPGKSILKKYGTKKIKGVILKYIDSNFDTDESFLTLVSTSLDIGLSLSASDEYFEFYNNLRRNNNTRKDIKTVALGLQKKIINMNNHLDKILYPKFNK